MPARQPCRALAGANDWQPEAAGSPTGESVGGAGTTPQKSTRESRRPARERLRREKLRKEARANEELRRLRATEIRKARPSTSGVSTDVQTPEYPLNRRVTEAADRQRRAAEVTAASLERGRRRPGATPEVVTERLNLAAPFWVSLSQAPRHCSGDALPEKSGGGKQVARVLARHESRLGRLRWCQRRCDRASGPGIRTAPSRCVPSLTGVDRGPSSVSHAVTVSLVASARR